jgi:hypothetical protein
MARATFRRRGNDRKSGAVRASTRRRPQASRPIRFEPLEERVLLSAVVVALSGQPQQIPLANVQPNQKSMTVVVNFSTTDPNETTENEELHLQTSTGWTWSTDTYNSQPVQVPLTAAGETLWGWIDGYDYDETGQVVVGDRVLAVNWSIDSKTLDALMNMEKQAENLENAVNAILSEAPGWHPDIGADKDFTFTGSLNGWISETPEGKIDQGHIELGIQVSAGAHFGGYYGWNVPLTSYGLNVGGGVKITPSISINAGGSFNVGSGQWSLSGGGNASGSVTLYAKGTVVNWVGEADLTGTIFDTWQIDTSGMVTGNVSVGGTFAATMQQLYPPLPTITIYKQDLGNLNLGRFAFSVQSLFSTAANNAMNGGGPGAGPSIAPAAAPAGPAVAGLTAGLATSAQSVLLAPAGSPAAGDPLVVTTQPPASVPAGTPFGLTVTAENADGSTDTAFNGSVTVQAENLGGLQGTTTVTAQNGVATFSGLSLTYAAYGELYVTSSVGDVYTDTFQVTALAASQLAFPGVLGPFGVDSTFDVQVEAEDKYGNDADFSGNVTIALAHNPTAATLGGTLTVAASQGTADFPTLSINKSGTGYTFQATGSGLTSATSPAFNVTDELVVTTQPPATITAGVPFPLVVKAEDGPGSVDTSFDGSVTVNSPWEQIGGTTTATAAGGVATFSGVTVETADDNEQLYLSASGLPDVYTNDFNVQPAAPSQLQFDPMVMPNGWSAGNPVVTPGSPFTVWVAVEDPYYNLANYSGNVTLALVNNPTGATLGGTLTVPVVQSFATFSNLTMDKFGTGYTLAATSSPGLPPATSSPFDVADELAITTPAPSSVTAGTPFGLVVEAEDLSRSVDTSYNGNVTVALSQLDGGSTSDLQGKLTVQAVDGVATFSGLTIDQAGPDGLTITGSDAIYTSQLLTVAPAKATELVATTEPPNATVGALFSVDISAEDAFGNIDPSYGGNVTLALLNNPGGAALGGTLTRPAESGVAAFPNLSINQAGSGYTLQATASTFSPTTTTAFNVTAAGVPTQLVLTSQPPQDLTAGKPFSVAVTAEDGAGTVDTNFTGPVTVTLAANPTGTSLGGTLTVTAVKGVATFSNLTIDATNDLFYPAQAYTVQASANGLAAATTGPVYVYPAAATQLVVSPPFGNVVTGEPFSVTVEALDAFGNVVDLNYSGDVTVALAANPGGATLGGTLTEPSYSGIATFSDLTLNKPGSGDTLQATSGSLPAATSTAFGATNDQLAVTFQPPDSIAAGSAFGLTVKAENGAGSVDTSFNGPVTLALEEFDGNNATLGGTLTVTAVNGVAAFSGLTVNEVGAYDLSATANGLPETFTNAVDVTASQLAVAAQPPALITAGAPFSVTVAARDASGDVDSTFNGPVTLALGVNPGGTALGGTLTATAINGVATFPGLTLSKPSSGYTLKATTTGLASATSSAITVTPVGTATQLVVASQPPASVTAGTGFGLVVKAEDSLGNVDSSFHGGVTVADPNAPLGGTLTENAVGGVATFSGLAIDMAGPAAPLAISAAGLAGATTSGVAVTPAVASQLVVPGVNTALLSGTASGVPLPTILTAASFGLQVSAEDPFGNVDPNFNDSVTLALGANPGGATLGGTLTVTAAAGVATFSNLSISKSGSGYTLQATGSGLTAGTGPAFSVTNDQLVVTTQPPATVTSGTPFVLAVTAENGAGTADTTFSGSVTVADPFFGQTLGGTTTVTAVKGVASFSGLTLSQADFADWLVAASGTLPAANSNTFDVVPGTPSQLAVLTPPPGNVSVAAPFEVDVAVEDAQGNLETGFSGNVTIALSNNPGGATLGGTLTAAATAGVAAFPGLTLNKAGSGYTLQATSTGLTPATSGGVNVTVAGVATQLVVTSGSPGTIAAGSPFGLTVTAEDGSGNLVSSFSGSVTLALAYNISGGSLLGTATVTAAGGVATFSGLSIDTAGNYTLQATGGGLNPVTTSSLTVSPLAATQLAVWGPDRGVLPGSAFGITVLAEDQYGNVDPNFGGNVTLALSNNPGGATLGGTLAAAASVGQASFSGLSINNLGSGYAIQASATGLTAGTSVPFDVTSDQLVVTAQPPASVSAGAGFGLTVAAENASGNVDASFTGNVTVALLDLTDTGATLSGTLSVTPTGGVATLSGLTLDKAGFYLLSATGDGVGSTCSQLLTVNVNLLVTPTITWNNPAAIAYGTALGSTQLDATAIDPNTKATVQGTFSYTLADGKTPANGAKLNAGPNQTLNVTFTPSDKTDYTTATGTTTITVVGPFDLTHSTLTALPSPASSGNKVTVTLTARDAFGSQELTGGLAVALSVKGAKGSLGKVTDNHDGTYTAIFTAGTTPGVDTFSATISKRAVTATASLTVVGPYSLAKSVVSVPASSVALGTPITVTLTALDALGQQELTGGLKVVFSLAKGSAGGTFSTVTDNHNGTYTVTFTGSKTGSDAITATINGKPLTSKAPKITVTAQGGVRLPAKAAATGGPATAQDAALLALLAESNGGTAGAGKKKGPSVSDLWLFDGA